MRRNSGRIRKRPFRILGRTLLHGRNTHPASQCTCTCSLHFNNQLISLQEFILASLAANKIDHGSSTARSDLPTPQELPFELNEPTKQYITQAEKNFDELVGKHELLVRIHAYFLTCFFLIGYDAFRYCTMKGTAKTSSRNSKPPQTHGCNSVNNSHSTNSTTVLV